MKVDLIYPKIPENSNIFLKRCIAFNKYDGTNLHWCWNQFDGWYAFGTRRTQFRLDKFGIKEFRSEHSELFAAPDLFNDYLRDRLSIYFSSFDIFINKDIIVFTEFYGPRSFAGSHCENDREDEAQRLVIIDVALDNKIIDPEAFISQFSTFDIAEVIYRGKYNGQFVEDVRNGKYKVNEGVVCKGIVDGELFMTKIKTKDYLKRLKKR